MENWAKSSPPSSLSLSSPTSSDIYGCFKNKLVWFSVYSIDALQHVYTTYAEYESKRWGEKENEKQKKKLCTFILCICEHEKHKNSLVLM